MSELTDEQIEEITARFVRQIGDHWSSEPAIREDDAIDFARAIIAAHEAGHRVNNPAITMVGCSFTGFNADGSEPFIYSEPDEAGKQTLTAINLIAWTAQGPISAATHSPAAPAGPGTPDTPG